MSQEPVMDDYRDREGKAVCVSREGYVSREMLLYCSQWLGKGPSQPIWLFDQWSTQNSPGAF